MDKVVTRGAASFGWFLIVFHTEENVEKVCRNQDKVEPKDCCPTNLGEGGTFGQDQGQDEDQERDPQHLSFNVSRNLHSCCSSTKPECIKNNQPGVVCLEKWKVDQESIRKK